MLKVGLELFVPIIVSNILHMLVVKKDIFSFLKIPIFTSAFGENKTYRGFIFVSFSTAILQLIFNNFLYGKFTKESFFLGMTIGFIFMFSELFNSFFKRRLGISAGGKSKKYSWFFTILDKTDSPFGLCLFFVFYKNLPSIYFWVFFIIAFLSHLSISQILYQLKVKKSL